MDQKRKLGAFALFKERQRNEEMDDSDYLYHFPRRTKHIPNKHGIQQRNSSTIASKKWWEQELTWKLTSLPYSPVQSG